MATYIETLKGDNMNYVETMQTIYLYGRDPVMNKEDGQKIIDKGKELEQLLTTIRVECDLTETVNKQTKVRKKPCRQVVDANEAKICSYATYLLCKERLQLKEANKAP